MLSRGTVFYIRGRGVSRSAVRSSLKPYAAVLVQRLRKFFQLRQRGGQRLDRRFGEPCDIAHQCLELLRLRVVPVGGLIDAALDPGAAEKTMKLTEEIVNEHHTTCLMITHNIMQGLHTGNRTLMMADGRIVLDLDQEERQKLTIPDLMQRFRQGAGSELDDDRILLSD